MVRAEVENLAASLPQAGLATTDLRTANVWLDTALVALDKDPPGYGEAPPRSRSSTACSPPTRRGRRRRSSHHRSRQPARDDHDHLHLNWKFRNRWDTVGFLPWYITS